MVVKQNYIVEKLDVSPDSIGRDGQRHGRTLSIRQADERTGVMRRGSRPNRALCLAVLGVATAACSSDPPSPGVPSGGAAGMAGALASAGTAPAGGAGAAGQGGSSPVGGTPASGGTSGGGGVASTGGSAGGGGSAGSDAAGGTSGGTAAACVGATLCDGFEYAGTELGPWKPTATGGTVVVDATHAFAGQKAIQFVSVPGGNKRTQLELAGAPLFPVANNKWWGRVMAYAHELPGMSDMEDKNVHYDLIQGSGMESAPEYRVAGMGGVLLNYNPHDCYYGTQKVIPEDKWACWEWLFDGSTNTIEFYIDGQLQARVMDKGQGCVDGTSSVWEAPTFSELRIGFVNYQSKAETTTLWLDELAAGPERISCPTPTAATH
jgi:hypothetical protein